MKPQIRILGIDDAAFKKSDKEVLLVGVLFRGGDFIDGIMSCKVAVDGDDATDRIIEMVSQSKFKVQIRALMLDGIAVGGFNVIDINRLSKALSVPVLAIMRGYPDLVKIKAALLKINMAHKIKLIDSAGKINEYRGIHYQVAGADIKEAEEFLEISTTHAHIPEPLRVAHLIAQGVSLGESRGRA